jgi:hypothetical protein
VVRAARAILAVLTLGACVMAACIVGDRPAADNLVCTQGECACAPSFGDCDARPENGCEARLDVDANHCGACGHTCLNGRCTEGSCGCGDGYADCNAVPADGCESFLAVDAANCGECGHDCLGGSCGDGHCQPFLLAELGNYIYAFAIDDENAYYCDGDSGILYRVPRQGGESVPLAVDQNCYEIAADGGMLFWTVREHGEELVRVVPVTGGTFTTIAIAEVVRGFVAAAGRVYFAAELAGAGYEVWAAESDGTRTSLAQSPDFVAYVAVQEGDVFFSAEGIDGTVLSRVPISGGTPTTLATIERTLAGMAVAGDGLYWLEAADEGEQPKIFRVPVSGGTPEELYSRNRQVDTILADATGLYWTEDQGDRIIRAPLAGGDFEVITQYQDITLPKLGSDALFWIDFPSHLFGLAK